MKYRDQMKQGFIDEFLKQGMFAGAMPLMAASKLPGKAIGTIKDTVMGSKDLAPGSSIMERGAYSIAKNFGDHGNDRGKQLAQQGMDAGLQNGKMEGLKNIMAGNPVYPQNAPSTGTPVSSMVKPVQDAQNWQPTTRTTTINNKQVKQVDPANQAPEVSTWQQLKHDVGNAFYKGDRSGNLGSKEFLGGANQVIGDKSYGLASMSDQGKVNLNPGNIQWGNLFKDHWGKILGGAGALVALPLLARSLFGGGQQQQQAPNIVINNGSVQPNMQRAFDKYR